MAAIDEELVHILLDNGANVMTEMNLSAFRVEVMCDDLVLNCQSQSRNILQGTAFDIAAYNYLFRFEDGSQSHGLFLSKAMRIIKLLETADRRVRELPIYSLLFQ